MNQFLIFGVFENDLFHASCLHFLSVTESSLLHYDSVPKVGILVIYKSVLTKV